MSKAAVAYSLRGSGMSWRQVADVLGYTGPNRAQVAANRAKHFATRNNLPWPQGRKLGADATIDDESLRDAMMAATATLGPRLLAVAQEVERLAQEFDALVNSLCPTPSINRIIREVAAAPPPTNNQRTDTDDH